MNEEFKLKKIDGKTYIFDIIRKKYVVLTPEEAVRQSILRLLLKKNYPPQLIKLEHGIIAGNNHKRTDITVYNPDGSIFMIVECKAPSVKLSDKTVNQIAMYNSVLNSQFLMITNSKQTFILEFYGDNYRIIEEIPDYKQ